MDDENRGAESGDGSPDLNELRRRKLGLAPKGEEPEQRPGGLRGLVGKFREVTYGMAAHDMTRYAMRSRASMEHLFILTTMGDLVGVPILPPYYSLRLLPYVVPQISTWKRRMLREKDLTDAMF